MGVDSISGPNSFFLGFSPLLLWAGFQFPYKVLFVLRVKQAILWAETLAAGSYCNHGGKPGWSGRETEGLVPKTWYIDFFFFFEGKQGMASQ